MIRCFRPSGNRTENGIEPTGYPRQPLADHAVDDVMTWVKLPDEFTEDCAEARLSDAAFRCHVEGLTRTMLRNTEGKLRETDLLRGLTSNEKVEGVRELVLKRWWEQYDDHWQIIRHMAVQRTNSQVDADRARARERQARARGRAQGELFEDADVPQNLPKSHGVTHGGSHATQTRPDRKVKTLPQTLARFGEFYGPYPRHVGKLDAQKAWAQALAKGADPDVIIAGAVRLAADPNLPPKDLIPYPASWLRRGGWEDDPHPPRSTGVPDGSGTSEAWQPY